jgi:hypothetical protein
VISVSRGSSPTRSHAHTADHLEILDLRPRLLGVAMIVGVEAEEALLLVGEAVAVPVLRRARRVSAMRILGVEPAVVVGVGIPGSGLAG